MKTILDKLKKVINEDIAEDMVPEFVKSFISNMDANNAQYGVELMTAEQLEDSYSITLAIDLDESEVPIILSVSFDKDANAGEVELIEVDDEKVNTLQTEIIPFNKVGADKAKALTIAVNNLLQRLGFID